MYHNSHVHVKKKLGVGKMDPKKDIGIQENKKTSFGLEVSVI
jgi:hypothetical protein